MERKHKQPGSVISHYEFCQRLLSMTGTVKVWDPRQKEDPVANMEPAQGENKRDCWTVAFGKLPTRYCTSGDYGQSPVACSVDCSEICPVRYHRLNISPRLGFHLHCAIIVCLGEITVCTV